MIAISEMLATKNRSHRTTAAPSRDLLERLFLTATDLVDWLDLGPVTVSGSAWWECIRVPEGLAEGNGRARLVAVLRRFSQAKAAAATGAEEITFRVPVGIRSGVWKKIPLVATRYSARDGTAGWHISFSH